MDDDGDDMDVTLDGASSKRACDICRTRKIRCDRSVPCSSCKTNKLVCTTTAPPQKAQRQRIHISEAYEKKIDRIEGRLANIEHVLANLALKLDNFNISQNSIEASSQIRPNRASVLDTNPSSRGDTSTPAPFEGETTINSQSDYARELLARAIDRTPSIGKNAEIKSALTALGELVSRQGQNNTASQPLINRSLADSDPANLDRPPWDEVNNALDQASKYSSMAFAIIFPFLKMKNLRGIIEEAYHNPGSCSATRRVLGYGVMESLFTHFKAFPMARVDISNYGTYATLCKRHLEVALSQLDIFMPATHENIMALVLGSAQAVSMCKPSLCWVMISAAAGLCQNLGYHRINTMSNDSHEDRNSKIHIFWMIYMFDKTLSLRLGRSSVIQDWDISLPPGIVGEQSTGSPNGSQMLEYWVKVARIQGQIYEKLFCPAAFQESPEERTRIAVELFEAMNLAWYERGDAPVAPFTSHNQMGNYVPHQMMKTKNSPSATELPSQRKRPVPPQPMISRSGSNEVTQGSIDFVEDIFFHSDVVVHYSTCALIQRAVSPENVTLDQDCLESSRAALAAHMRANAQFNSKGNEELWSGYVHWSILQAPFTPFIVIFCNAVQNVDASDLNSLSDFVASLESCRTISEGADKLYKMCHLLHQVAKLYLRLKTQDITSRSQPSSQPDQPFPQPTTDGTTQMDLNAINTSFDPYLSALGLLPNSAWPMAGFPEISTSSSNTDAFLYDQEIGGAAPPGMEAGSGGFGMMPGGNQNFVQDWFSGSRYLMNLMEAGDDLHMPDLEL